MTNDKEQTYRLDVPYSVVDRVVGALRGMADDSRDEMRSAEHDAAYWAAKTDKLDALADGLEEQRDADDKR